MFHPIPSPVRQRMEFLEAQDERDRSDGTPHALRLRQIPPETGRFLALLASAAPQGAILEIGTSAGYSSLWLSLACRHTQRRLTTFELSQAKASLAAETFRQAEVEPWVELVNADALARLVDYPQIAFCFLDTEKSLYQSCYDLIVPRLVPGGWLVADNVISHAAELQPMLNHALQDERLDAAIFPIGKGLLVCRKP
ncbi:MAG TPA: O-methyltransferase [Anaerolineales bacterium]|nr:O-methyltransferase [Anaerolineales bacterium]